jgi:hypothetical protein
VSAGVGDCGNCRAADDRSQAGAGAQFRGVRWIEASTSLPVSGELLREPIVPTIAPYPVGVNDEIRETRCD